MAEVVDAKAHFKPLLGFRAPSAEDARVVDERVQMVIPLRKRRRERAYAVQVGKVEPHERDVASRNAGEFVRRAFPALFIAAGENDARAKVRNLCRGRLPDAGIGARDDDNFSLHVPVYFPIHGKKYSERGMKMQLACATREIELVKNPTRRIY
ncbi:hypothetical protein SDC9_114569 [bioreactor metagenome]|uniref:Uncharacterized protein n=1 Tax=bioreactor metagenome TaxID=1076179 RepID=A0A645BQR8_9ZZZZ